MRFWDTMLSFVFPAKCTGCGRAGTELCLECLHSVPTAERESAKWIFPIFDYRDPLIKKTLHLFKYKGRQKLARSFGEVLRGKIFEELSEIGPLQNFSEPLLVPIPLSRRRLRERGYNQAELLCREIMELNEMNFSLETKILCKPKETEHQARIKDRRLRMENARGTFAINNTEAVRGQNIILIDDITTTGATLAEARRVLRLAGARRVIAFTIAH